MPDLALLRQRVAELAGRNILVGTSSWKYEGWLGQIYSPERYTFRGKVSKARFQNTCLEEYAETFRTVCVDAGFYRFPDERYIEKLANQVPDDFRFSFKVTDEITVKTFSNLPRHGERAGKPNANFLNADIFIREFLGPCSAYREKIGVLMFEFSHFHPRDFARGRDFVAALDSFLGALPSGWQYGVEVRNRNLLQPQYFETLNRHGVTHVFNSWTAMPSVTEQMAREGSFTTDFFASRFLLKPGRKYEEAVKSFAPYDDTKEVNEEARAAMKKLSTKQTKKPSFLFVNNRLEGNSLNTIRAMVGA